MDKDELLHKYLHRQLTTDERDEFDKLYTTDPEFAEEVQLQVQLFIAMRARAVEIEALDIEHGGGGSTGRYWGYWAMAASVLLIATLGAFLLFSGSSLFDQYFDPYPSRWGVRDVGDPDYREAVTMRSYVEGNYEAGIAAINSYLKEGASSEAKKQTMYLYRGIMELRLDKHDSAAVDLSRVIAMGGELVSHGQWYLALSYLKSGDHGDAEGLLRNIADKQKNVSRFKVSEANELLSRISSD